MPLGNQLSWNSWSFLKCVSNLCRFDFRFILAWLQVPPIGSPQQSDHALAASAALTGSAHACKPRWINSSLFVGRVSAFFLWALSVWATLRCVSLDLFCTACRDNRDHYTDLCDWLRVDLTCRQQQRDINSYLFQWPSDLYAECIARNQHIICWNLNSNTKPCIGSH